MKARQWINDYVDFAIPLIMVIVALNLVEVFIKLPYEYNPIVYTAELKDFFKFNAHLSVFMNQVETGKLFLYSLALLGIALFLRLFTNKLQVSLDYPIKIVWIYFATIYEFITNRAIVAFEVATFVFIEGLIILGISLSIFKILKTFFANCNFIIKNISYLSILILAILILLIDKLEIVKLSSFVKQNILIAILCFIVISVLYYSLKAKKIIPQDITEYEIKSISDAQDIVDSMNEKRKIKNIIRDLIDYAKK